MKFVLRIDDIGWMPEHKRDEGLLLAQELHRTLNGLPYVAAVIPTMLDSKGHDWLNSNPEAMTIAVHGLTHGEVEFRNLSESLMNFRVAEARKILISVPCRDMVLPFNQYEVGLAEACAGLGIDRLWGGGNHTRTDPSEDETPPTPYPLERVCFIPSWKTTYVATHWRIRDDIPALVDTLPKIIDLPGKAVITLHITWEAAYSKNLTGIRWLAGALEDRIISVEEFLK